MSMVIPRIFRKITFSRNLKNLSVLVFPIKLGSIKVVLWATLQRVQGWIPESFSYLKVLQTWKYNSGLFYNRWLFQNKQTAASKGTLIDFWKVDNYFYFKNVLTYPNKKSKTTSFSYFFTSKEVIFALLKKLHTVDAVSIKFIR